MDLNKKLALKYYVILELLFKSFVNYWSSSIFSLRKKNQTKMMGDNYGYLAVAWGIVPFIVCVSEGA